MKKIPSLFKRMYDGDRQIYDEVVEGCEWAAEGEGVATEKFDGTACMVKDGKLYKRYNRKPSKKVRRNHVAGALWARDEFNSPPAGWIACEESPDFVTAHWPGWIPVSEDKPEDKYHRKVKIENLPDGTYELVGPKIQGNPYGREDHLLLPHGMNKLSNLRDRTFNSIKRFLLLHSLEGIVFHHLDGRMCKVKKRDFGFEWPGWRPTPNCELSPLKKNFAAIKA